jgi:hypothetical protein
MQVSVDKLSHSSDHFPLLLELCEGLLERGMPLLLRGVIYLALAQSLGFAFVDDTNRECMQTERAEGVSSRNRDNSLVSFIFRSLVNLVVPNGLFISGAVQNFEMWEEMKQGTPRGRECCVRLKVRFRRDLVLLLFRLIAECLIV